MSVDAPLNYGQLYSWREIETYPQDWLQEANLSTNWDLRGHPVHRVEEALRRLVDRHEPLRTTYHLRGGTPVQQVHATVEPPVELVDRVLTGYGDLDTTREALAAVPIPMTSSLGWRGELVTSGGAPMFLSVSFSHLIVDVWSVQKLTAQFHALLADLDSETPAGPSPRQLALRQRAECRREPRDGVHGGADRYWRRVLAGRPEWDPPSLPSGGMRHRIQATLRSRRLGGLAAAAARRHNATTPAVLMALVAAGLSRHTGTSQVTLSLMSSNRFAPEHQHVVGTLNQLIPVVATVDPGGSLAEHVKRLHWAAARAYRHSCYDYDRVAAIATGATAPPAHGCWFNHLFRCWFNYLQLDEQPCDPADGSPAELVWTPVARQYGQPVDVRVSVEGGCTSVALRADPAVLPAEALTDVLRAVALGVQLAGDGTSTVRDLWRPRAALPASLFPAELPEPAA